MRPTARRAAPVLATVIALLGPGLPASAGEEVQIEEWQVDIGGRPRDPFASGPDTVWFVGQAGDYIGRLTPSTGTMDIRPVDGAPGLHNLVVGADGIVWFAGSQDAHIGRYDPETDQVGRIAMPDESARDPHTLVFDADQSHIWFTVHMGNFIGRLSLADHAVDLIALPSDFARPSGIRVAPDGTVWAALAGTNRLAEIDPETLAVTEHLIPSERARPRRLEVAPDGTVWYADYRGGVAGHFDPETGRFGEVALPSGKYGRPFGTALDAAGTVWIAETGVQPNQLVAVDTETRQVRSATPVPSGAGTIRHMHYFSAENEVWFATDAATIGRLEVPAQ